MRACQTRCLFHYYTKTKLNRKFSPTVQWQGKSSPLYSMYTIGHCMSFRRCICTFSAFHRALSFGCVIYTRRTSQYLFLQRHTWKFIFGVRLHAEADSRIRWIDGDLFRSVNLTKRGGRLAMYLSPFLAEVNHAYIGFLVNLIITIPTG